MNLRLQRDNNMKTDYSFDFGAAVIAGVPARIRLVSGNG
ncbi:hypothetical protein PALA111701_05765 [Paenibacillus lactis]